MELPASSYQNEASQLPNKHAIAMALHEHGHKLHLPDEHHTAVARLFDEHGDNHKIASLQAQRHLGKEADPVEIREHIDALCSQISMGRGEDVTHIDRGMDSTIESPLTTDELRSFLLHANNRDSFTAQMRIALEDADDKHAWLEQAQTTLENMLVIVEGMRHVAINEAKEQEHDAIHESHDAAIAHLMQLKANVRIQIANCETGDPARVVPLRSSAYHQPSVSSGMTSANTQR